MSDATGFRRAELATALERGGGEGQQGTTYQSPSRIHAFIPPLRPSVRPRTVESHYPTPDERGWWVIGTKLFRRRMLFRQISSRCKRTATRSAGWSAGRDAAVTPRFRLSPLVQREAVFSTTINYRHRSATGPATVTVLGHIAHWLAKISISHVEPQWYATVLGHYKCSSEFWDSINIVYINHLNFINENFTFYLHVVRYFLPADGVVTCERLGSLVSDERTIGPQGFRSIAPSFNG